MSSICSAHQTRDLSCAACLACDLIEIKRKDAAERRLIPVRAVAGPARNAPCPCGSGRKFKRCCYLTAAEKAHAAREAEHAAIYDRVRRHQAGEYVEEYHRPRLLPTVLGMVAAVAR